MAFPMIPAVLMGAMAGMQIVGGIVQSNQIRAAGKAQQQALRYQASLQESQANALTVAAGQDRAAAQRAMIAERQQGALVSGRARALAAASGADVTSPSVLANLADIGATEDYRVGLQRYAGSREAVGKEYSAALERAGASGTRELGSYQNQMAQMEGNQAMSAGINSALFTGIQGANALGLFDNNAAASSRTSSPVIQGGVMPFGSPMFAKYGKGGPNKGP